MKKLHLSKAVLTGAVLAAAGNAYAVPVVMEGSYIRTAISDDGTLGYGGTTSPGLLYDPSGTSMFTGSDYLTPGTPWEMFSVSTTQSGVSVNNNAGSDAITGSITASAGSADQEVHWSGSYGGLFSIDHIYSFNDGDARINVTTTITALSNIDNVLFARAIDPDQDALQYGAYQTNNTQVSADYVVAAGAVSGVAFGLYSNSAIAHNTGISSVWSSDPNTYWSGVNNGNGDYTIGLAFSLGNMTAGQSVSFSYAYVLGESIDSAVVPVPAAAWLLGSGLVGLVGASRRKK